MKYKIFDDQCWCAEFKDVRLGCSLDLELLSAQVGAVRSVKQVHGVAILDDASWTDVVQEADALVSNQPDTALVIRTADCVPVHLTDGHRIALAHAGWRGTAGGIVVELLRHFAPSEVVAVIGPSISAANYEVDADLYQDWLDREPKLVQWLLPGRGGSKRHLDLRGYIVAQLISGGVDPDRLIVIPTCTYASGLPSYRRTGKASPSIHNYIYRR